MSPQELGAIAGVVLSLALAYVPAFRKWYDQFDAPGKARVMGALLVGAAVGVFALSCVNLIVLVACTVQGALDLFWVLVAALMANQATFLIAVRPFKSA